MKKVKNNDRIITEGTTTIRKLSRICDNCLVSGNNVISYETHVATVNGSDLIVLGYWSKTTSRHIKKTAETLGLTIKYLSE